MLDFLALLDRFDSNCNDALNNVQTGSHDSIVIIINAGLVGKHSPRLLSPNRMSARCIDENDDVCALIIC